MWDLHELLGQSHCDLGMQSLIVIFFALYLMSIKPNVINKKKTSNVHYTEPLRKQSHTEMQ